MKRLAIHAGIVLVLAACGGDGGTEPDPETGSIAGTVRNGSTGVASVAVSLTGLTTRNTTTNASGAFTFTSLAPGAYTVAITVPQGLQMVDGENATRPATVSAGQTTTLNFGVETPVPTTGTLTGTVSAGGAAVAGATLNVTGDGIDRNALSAGNGAYTFTLLPAGAYDVEITPPAGFGLAPGEQGVKTGTVTAGGTTTINFSLAELNPPTIITAGASSFSPADVTVAVGARVRWTNSSGVAHTVTPSGHSEWASAALPNQGTFEHIFDTAGTFNYLCTIHAGMTGVVRVQ